MTLIRKLILNFCHSQTHDPVKVKATGVVHSQTHDPVKVKATGVVHSQTHDPVKVKATGVVQPIDLITSGCSPSLVVIPNLSQGVKSDEYV